MREQFKPIAVENPAGHPWLFLLRRVVDLQLATIVRDSVFSILPFMTVAMLI